MLPNDMSKNILGLLLLNDHLSAKLILTPPLLNPLRDGPVLTLGFVSNLPMNDPLVNKGD